MGTQTGLDVIDDGDRLRVKKTEQGTTTYYLRSSVLGGQVICELNESGAWMRGYVYLGSQLLALQHSSAVHWVHQDPVVKSQRVTEANASVSTGVELDPWGGETSRSWNQYQQPQRYTSYLRDGNESDEAMMRRYNRWWSRFDQPDPYDGSYNLTDPQSFNRYSYVQNDPVNFVDPTGLDGSLTQGITSARNALQNPTCRNLFGNTNPTKLLNSMLGKGQIRVSNSYPTTLRLERGRLSIARSKNFKADEAGITSTFNTGRSQVNYITINQSGPYFTGQNASGESVSQLFGFRGLSLPDFQGLAIIHELLHVVERIPSDACNWGRSALNSELVRLFCFDLPNRLIDNPPANIITELSGLGGGGDVNPTPLIMVGRGDIFDSFRWLDLWIDSMRQGQGSVGNIIYEEMFDE